jgi:hypothetical protein
MSQPQATGSSETLDDFQRTTRRYIMEDIALFHLLVYDSFSCRSISKFVIYAEASYQDVVT